MGAKDAVPIGFSFCVFFYRVKSLYVDERFQ